jgi:outer membrane protein W
MKKLIIFLMAVTTVVAAQPAFHKSAGALTIGYGFPNIFKRLMLENLQNSDPRAKSIASRNGASFTYSTSGGGPFFVKYDYAVSDKLGLGIVLGYSRLGVTETYHYTRFVYNPQTQNTESRDLQQSTVQLATSFSAGLRCNYHFNPRKKIDPYIGFAVGYSRSVFEESFETSDPDLTQKPVVSSSLIPLYASATVGLRVYLSKYLGVYMELGFDKWALLQTGLALKLPQ